MKARPCFSLRPWIRETESIWKITLHSNSHKFVPPKAYIKLCIQSRYCSCVWLCAVCVHVYVWHPMTLTKQESALRGCEINISLWLSVCLSVFLSAFSCLNEFLISFIPLLQAIFIFRLTFWCKYFVLCICLSKTSKIYLWEEKKKMLLPIMLRLHNDTFPEYGFHFVWLNSVCEVELGNGRDRTLCKQLVTRGHASVFSSCSFYACFMELYNQNRIAVYISHVTA